MKKRYLLPVIGLCASLACCAQAESYTAGTYTAATQGMKPMTIEVTFSEDAITGVNITEHGETYGIGYGMPTSPVETLPAWIVENQSLACDTVTGANITTNAIIRGVADAVAQAGGDADALKAKTVAAEVKDETLDCDVVVVGAGAAGLGAAVSAVENGANVILLEKQGIPGGSTTRSGGYFIAAGTDMQKAQGIEDTPEALFEFYKSKGGDLLDDAKVMDYCQNSAATLQWLIDNGAEFDHVETVHPVMTVERVHASKGGSFMGSGQGGPMTVPMAKSFIEKGGDLICNADVNELVLDADGNIAGVKAAMKDGSTLTVNAKAVILATGGYAGDPEQCKRFTCMPNYAGYAPSSDTGDANTLVEAVDGKVEWSDAANITMVSGTTGIGCFGETSLIVSEAGERVCNEYCYFYTYTEALINAGSTCGWYITSASDPFPTAQYAMTLASTPHADNAADLAAQIGVDPDTLTATIARYNELCAAGEDSDFGKPSSFMLPLEGEIYAIQLTPGISGTYGGVVTDITSRVINNSGEVVPGLYAAGEASFCGLVGTEYPCCGTAIGTAFYFGKVAGADAVAYISK